MMESRYAIVDIETTGSKMHEDAITEIGIVFSNGREVTGTYHTLINPGCEIPRFISALTGIDNALVEGEPVFEDVAEEIANNLEGKIFIAHNVGFDYGFVKSSLARYGFDYHEQRLCTVRLARKVIPGLHSYSLGRLCNQLGIQINDRHRAMGDAAATAELFHLIVSRDSQQWIQQALNGRSREAIMPPNLPKQVFNNLPHSPGVYYFEDEKGDILYIGKAKNIKQRVYSHLVTDLNKKNLVALRNKLFHITFELTGTELIAYLLESYEIKRLKPPFNKAQRKTTDNFGLFSYFDSRGYARFAIDRLANRRQPLAAFSGITEVRDFLYNVSNQFKLCKKLSGLQHTNESCNEYKLGLCQGACVAEEEKETYNARHFEAESFIANDKFNLLLIGKGREESEKSLVGFRGGRFLGFGYTGIENSISTLDDALDFLKPFPDNTDIQRIIKGYLRQSPVEVIVRS